MKIMHLASPFTLDVPDFKKFLVDPAIRGTLTILEAASTAPAVKRVVITSSFAAINVVSLGLRPGHTYTETDWNTETYEGAITTTNSSVAYCAGKALAEKAAWDYIKEKKPHFSISVVNPPKIFGPSQQKLSLSSLGISMTEIYGLINGNMKDVPPTGFWAWVDVRDVAEAHLRAFKSADAANERFFITGGRYTYQQICEVLRASPKIPDSVKSKIPRGDPKDVPGPHVYDVDNSKSIRVLGMKYRALEDTMVDAALNLLEYM
jgi:nucleoside-diphosphate-sugar epimerase